MERTYRILIAEDDAIISETLKDYVEEMGHTVIGIVSNYEEALSFCDEQPDFVFLDIRMHGKDEGFKIAKAISENYLIPFLFLTSFSDKKMIQEAAKFKPAAYLIKPFTKHDIYAALEIAIAKVEVKNADKIELKDGQKYYYINPKEVLFIQSEDKYLSFQYTNKRLLIRANLKDINTKLPAYFVQCHRSYIINTQFVSTKTTTDFTIGSHHIPISKSFKEEL
ncbi:MAG: response regulator [Bacteroidetes bacterium]|nr:response regulator [Bacteroidota bacterium]